MRLPLVPSWIPIVVIFALLVGCEHKMNPSSNSDSAPATSQLESSTPSQVHQRSLPLPKVPPGTLLREDHFQQTLQATGAKLIIVQVYLESCGACMTEALKLSKEESHWYEQGISILGLGMDETAQGSRAFYAMTGKRITFPLYWAPWFARQQKIVQTPTLLIYAKDGRQLFRTDAQQAEEGMMAALKNRLSELLLEY